MRAVVVGCVSFVVGLLVLGVFPHPSPAQTAETQRRFVVLFKGARIPPGAGSLIESAGGKLARIFPEVGIAVAISDSPTFSDALSRSGPVDAVGEDREHPLPAQYAAEFEPEASGSALAFAPDPSKDDLYFLRQWHIRRVRADVAWAAGVTGSSDIVVAIIDTGVASNHPDLIPNLRFSNCFSQAGRKDEDCVSYPSILFNLQNTGGAHGTMVAGIVAAAFGHGRVVGVGPNLSIASYNVFREDPITHQPIASESAIFAAMLDAATLDPLTHRTRAQVINLSLGSLILRPQDNALWKAWNRVVSQVVRQGVTIVASAGNEGISTNGPVAHVPSDVPQVISIGATGIRPCPFVPDPQHVPFDVLGTVFRLMDDTIREVPYSDFGAAVDLVAPGGDSGSLILPQCFRPNTTLPEPRTSWGIQSTAVMSALGCATTVPLPTCATGYLRGPFGTSFAAPHVAGVVGLMLSQNPNLNPHQVAAILKRTAQPLGDRQEFGHGMVDAAAAVDAATAAVAP